MDFLDNAVTGAIPVITGIKVMSPAEKQLRPILFDEGIQVLSNFELNQIASLTYNDITCDEIFELIEQICRKPLDHTPLNLQKSLIATKHVLVFGSEKTVNNAYGILDYIKALLEFNTVLMTQKQGGAMSFFQTLQGGGVDKGGPVREAAGEVVKLLSNINELRQIRTSSASKDSLVPVGDAGVAFVTDDVRLYILKRKIEEEKKIRIRSNLKKSEGGFGAGYTSQNGKSVVGASHGIEEMIKMANIQTNKFSDDFSRPSGHKTQEEIILEELKAESDAAKAVATSDRNNNATATGLLGSFHPTASAAPDIDLLDFGTSCGENLTVNNQIGTTGDLLGGNMYTNFEAVPAVSNDPFSLSNQSTSTSYNYAPADSLLDLMSASVSSTPVEDPFAAINDNSNKSNNNINNSKYDLNMNNNNNPTMTMQIPVLTSGDITGMNSLSSGMTNISLAARPVSSSSMLTPIDGPMMTSTNEDRFAALDDLATSQPSSGVTALDAKNAENRLYNQDTNCFSSYNNNIMCSTGSMPSRMSESASVSTGGRDGYSFSVPMGMSVPAITEGMIAPGSGQVAKAYGDSVNTNEENPWMMGGSAGDGQGLIPVGPPPRSAPPPPPPS